jgi:mRNA interferase HigB
MRIISKVHLKQYAESRPTTAAALEHWRRTVEAADWATPQDAQKSFSSARPISNGRVIFEIANGHRMIVGCDYERKLVYMKFIGTHAEYDKVDATTVNWY